MVTVIWGDSSVVTDGPMMTKPCSVTNSTIMNYAPPRYTADNKVLFHAQLQSKILAYQVMQLFDKDGQRTLEIEKDLFTWTSTDGHETKQDGALLVVLVLFKIKPNFHVDMQAKKKNIKELTLKQHENNPEKYPNEMKLKKLLIDEKDPDAQQFLRKGFFSQPLLLPVDSYALEYEQMRTHWLCGKEVVLSNSLY